MIYSVRVKSQIKVDKIHMLVVRFLIQERPSGLKNDRPPGNEDCLSVGKKLKSRIGGENSFKEKIGLLIGHVIGKRHWFRKGDVDVGAFRKV